MIESPSGAPAVEISLTVNGKPQILRARPMERLLDVLRHQLGLTGAKEGCGEGECGSCAILLNGELVVSCLIPVLQVQGADIVTIEGLPSTDELHALQRSFLDCGGAQCGICTPGMILAASHLLRKNARPTRDDIREALSGNLCRCTGYLHVLKAVEQARHLGNSESGPKE